MTAPPDLVVVPYARFLEYQERRRAIAAALADPIPPTNDAGPETALTHPPASVSTAWSTS
jgi:hypothetical protein